jgi:hypothetical protein
VTSRLKARAMFQVLSLAPMERSEPRFRALADAGDIEEFWRYYENCMRTKPELDVQIEERGQPSFRMLRPAMEAIYAVASDD